MPEPPKPATVKPILRGQEYVAACEGGFVRRPAPDDGLLIETADCTHFVAAEVARAALAKIGKP